MNQCFARTSRSRADTAPFLRAMSNADATTHFSPSWIAVIAQLDEAIARARTIRREIESRLAVASVHVARAECSIARNALP